MKIHNGMGKTKRVRRSTYQKEVRVYLGGRVYRDEKEGEEANRNNTLDL